MTTPKEAEASSNRVGFMFVGFLVGVILLIMGAVRLVQWAFFSHDELARISITANEGEASFEVAASQEIHVRLDMHSDREMRDAEFSELLVRGELSLVLTSPNGTTQNASCKLYNGWSETTHSRERLRRPFFEGAQNDCHLRVREAGIQRLRVAISPREAPIRSTVARVLSD